MEKKIELLQTIENHFINKRLDYWLRKKYPDSSFNLICKLIRKGVIRVNGSRATQSIVLSKNDKIKVPKVLIDNKKQDLEQTFSKRFRDKVLKWIIFCNKDFIAINKPSKVSVQGGSKIKISLDSLYQIFKLDYQEKPKLVHRIDKDTSGLLLISRTLEYAQYLTKLFKNRKIQKTYIAITSGLVKIDKAIINISIKHKDKILNAKTYYRVLTKSKNHSLLIIRPDTGRKHQIRKHLMYLNNPLVGDKKYNNKKTSNDLNSDFLNLHSYSLSFQDKNGEYITLTAKPPYEMLQNLKKLDFNFKSIKADYFLNSKKWLTINEDF